MFPVSLSEQALKYKKKDLAALGLLWNGGRIAPESLAGLVRKTQSLVSALEKVKSLLEARKPS